MILDISIGILAMLNITMVTILNMFLIHEPIINHQFKKTRPHYRWDFHRNLIVTIIIELIGVKWILAQPFNIPIWLGAGIIPSMIVMIELYQIRDQIEL